MSRLNRPSGLVAFLAIQVRISLKKINFWVFSSSYFWLFYVVTCFFFCLTHTSVGSVSLFFHTILLINLCSMIVTCKNNYNYCCTKKIYSCSKIIIYIFTFCFFSYIIFLIFLLVTFVFLCDNFDLSISFVILGNLILL